MAEVKLTADTEENSELVFERLDENERTATRGKRRLLVVRVENGDLWRIKSDRGVLPKEMQGSFTSPSNAYAAISNYWK